MCKSNVVINSFRVRLNSHGSEILSISSDDNDYLDRGNDFDEIISISSDDEFVDDYDATAIDYVDISYSPALTNDVNWSWTTDDDGQDVLMSVNTVHGEVANTDGFFGPIYCDPYIGDGSYGGGFECECELCAIPEYDDHQRYFLDNREWALLEENNGVDDDMENDENNVVNSDVNNDGDGEYNDDDAPFDPDDEMDGFERVLVEYFVGGHQPSDEELNQEEVDWIYRAINE